MLSNHVDLIFFDTVSSCVTVMISRFKKQHSRGPILANPESAKGDVKKVLAGNVFSTTSSYVALGNFTERAPHNYDHGVLRRRRHRCLPCAMLVTPLLIPVAREAYDIATLLTLRYTT